MQKRQLGESADYGSSRLTPGRSTTLSLLAFSPLPPATSRLGSIVRNAVTRARRCTPLASRHPPELHSPCPSHLHGREKGGGWWPAESYPNKKIKLLRLAKVNSDIKTLAFQFLTPRNSKAFHLPNKFLLKKKKKPRTKESPCTLIITHS